MRLPRNVRIFRGQLDAAPFLSVFFLLVILVVFHTSLVFYPGVEISLPDSAPLSGVSGPVAVVAVDSNGKFYFRNRTVTDSSLQALLEEDVRRIGTGLTLVIQADRTTSQERLTQLSRIASDAGIRKALLATASPRPNPSNPKLP